MSLLFYYWTEKNYVLVLITSMCANYGFALLIEKYGGQGSSGKRKIALSIAIVFNIAFLVCFKYLDFALGQFAFFGMFTGFVFAVPNIYLPIGISFFTFKAFHM